MWTAANQAFKQPPSAPVVVASYLLDAISTTVQGAYSLRLLRAAYAGSAIRVRRSSDNTEQDIGFVSGALDTTSLLAFCGTSGTSNGYVSKIYDQSSLGQDLGQVYAGSQPTIVLAGTVAIMPNATARPAMSFPSPSAYQLGKSGFVMPATSVFASAAVASRANTVQANGRLLSYTGSGASNDYSSSLSAILSYWDGSNVRSLQNGSGCAVAVPTTVPFQSIATFNGSSGTTISIDATSSSSGGAAGTLSTSGYMAICGDTSGAESWNGFVSEMLIFSGTFLSADQITVKSNQKTYYGTP